MAGRDDFNAATLQMIAKRAGYFCSHPTCGRLTVGPSEDRKSGVTMVGIAAHIVAAAGRGPRADPSLTSAQRSAAANGIWMCAIHAKWIDDNPSSATIGTLHAWKTAHEAEISAWVEHGHPGIFKCWDRLSALTRDQRDTIVTELPNHHAVARDGSALLEVLERSGHCLVSGDSGVGKSALVKTTLDTAFPDTRQVWLGPEVLGKALSEAQRGSIELSAPLSVLFEAAATPGGILVCDAVERTDALSVVLLAKLVGELAEKRDAGTSNWRVVTVAQQAGFDVHLDPLIGLLGENVISVGPLELQDVQAALHTVPALAQHAYDAPFVALLGNLRTLAWIISAGPQFAGIEPGRMAARFQIADRLWRYWTQNDANLHSFMIALARRDAEYERSFGLSDLGADDRAAWNAGKARLPLSLSDRNRLSFEHDLASDWARYKYLKEIGSDVERWSGLASQPLWVAALRMFGQYLLREADQAAQGWDGSFAAAQAIGATAATDVLLDALALDPLADQFLASRTALLFADNGKLLDRLLVRFMHISTVPRRGMRHRSDPSVSLYAESEMRAPVWGLWPPMIRFLVEQREAISAFGSHTVAKLCEMWLTEAPLRIEGGAVLGRVGLAELALETARTDQIKAIAYDLFGGGSDADGGVYAAALSGGEDLPEAVSAFALEMARRRPLPPATQDRINALRRAERKRRRESAKTQRRRKLPAPEMSFLQPRKLPPWPLGPSGRLNDRFRTAVMKDGGLNRLANIAPEVAAEVLLACIVEDNPHEERGGMMFDRQLGLNYDHSNQPVIFWSSPFMPLLLRAGETALDALLQLLEFCTERWASHHQAEEQSPLRLQLADGSAQEYRGDYRVLDWAHVRDATSSQLFSALDALERCLWMKIKAGENVDALLASLFMRSNSAAILGILADCAKLAPDLLRGPLAPLLSSPALILREEYRLNYRFGSDFVAWQRAGEAARALGAEWEQAPHRTSPLKHAIRDLRRDDATFDSQMRDAIFAWPAAEAEMDLRQRALAEELDPSNWEEAPREGNKGVSVFRYSAAIAAEIAAMQPTMAEAPAFGAIMHQLRKMLEAWLNDDEAADVYSVLDDQEALAHCSEPERQAIEIAIAALLFSRASNWVWRDPVIAERLGNLVDQAKPLISSQSSPIDDRLELGPNLVWAAVGALYARAFGHGDPDRWDRVLSYALATGDRDIVGTIVGAARELRSELGAHYQAIVECAVFAAALNALRPRMEGDPGSIEMAAHWRRRLARRQLARSQNPQTLNLVSLSNRVERLWHNRFERAFGPVTTAKGRKTIRRRYAFGVSTDLLFAIFGWAFAEEQVPPADDLPEHRQVIRMLWDLIAWQLRDDPDEPVDENESFRFIDNHGTTILQTIAARTPLGTAAESRIMWEPVLALGPRGEYTLEHMIGGFFLRLYKDPDPANFISNWDAMLAVVFAPGWANQGKWWKGRSILRRMLGIDAAHQLSASPKVMAHVKNLKPYFERFAAEHIARDDSTLSAFAHFLAKPAGASLRLDAIRWIEAALIKDDTKLRNNEGSALASLARILLAEHSVELVADRPTREALINVIGRMVRDQAPYALTLQDRARALR